MRTTKGDFHTKLRDVTEITFVGGGIFRWRKFHEIIKQPKNQSPTPMRDKKIMFPLTISQR